MAEAPGRSRLRKSEGGAWPSQRGSPSKEGLGKEGHSSLRYMVCEEPEQGLCGRLDTKGLAVQTADAKG